MRQFGVYSYAIVAFGYALFLWSEVNDGGAGAATIIVGAANTVANAVLGVALWLLITYLPQPIPSGVRLSIRTTAIAEVTFGIGLFALSTLNAHSLAGSSLIVIGVGDVLLALTLFYWTAEAGDALPELPTRQHRRA